MKYQVVLLVFLSFLLGGTANASATYSGHVTGVQIVDTGSMDFRVTLDTNMPACNLNFAYVNHSSALFSAFVADITTAYSTNKPINLQVNVDSNGYCNVYFFSF